ncbi:hypothetical protein BY458DRAFT_432732 [Sporodiniella umbellata]|nr:hypothetical protein BY458DRAFT_432732 [Sporodiniella umbellata]
MSEAYKKRDETIDYCLKFMDQELDKANKVLQEDPDDFSVKNHIYTQESIVMFILFTCLKDSLTPPLFFFSVSPFLMKSMSRKLLGNVLHRFSKTNVEPFEFKNKIRDFYEYPLS